MIVDLAIALAAVAILAAVVVLAMGRGGELSAAHPDHPQLHWDRPPTGVDVISLRLPRGLFGYHVAITDEALHKMGLALAERENQVAMLTHELAAMRGEAAPREYHHYVAPPAEQEYGPYGDEDVARQEDGRYGPPPDEATPEQDVWEASGIETGAWQQAEPLPEPGAWQELPEVAGTPHAEVASTGATAAEHPAWPVPQPGAERGDGPE